MIRFNNDYCYGAMPELLEAMGKVNKETYPGYGTDDWCKKAADKIRSLTGRRDADVHFFAGATQANLTVIQAALTSVQSVIAPTTGHINCHEAASIENTGHKILELVEKDGKISAQQIRDCAEAYQKSGEAEYLTEPKLVYISFPTEEGTLYSLKELKDISAVCRKYDLYLFVDGARLSYGLGSKANDVTLKDLGKLADVFYFGGTKCGAPYGEAVVLLNRNLKRRFKAVMKQQGAVLAKGWLPGLFFYTMLESGEYFHAAERADLFAMEIRHAFEKKGIPLGADSYTNQQFVILNEKQKKTLAKKYIFEEEGETEQGFTVRFCTCWATTRDEVNALIQDIENL